MRKILLVAAGALALWMTASYFMGSLLGLHGSGLWILRSLLVLLGIIAAVAVVWFMWDKRKRAAPEERAESAAAASDDIDLLIRDARAKLATAQAEKGGKVSSLPAIFLIGETGSAKTSTLVNSGIDPELLAGQVYRDSALIPTPAANIWYAHRAVFVEAAGKSVAESGVWANIAKRLQPGRLSSAFGGSTQPPRAALVMVEAESLIRPGAADAVTATARALRARLGEISQSIGVNLPVYVLFTKMDRVPFFTEFVRNLTNEEAAQVLGVTVPVALGRSGVYAEQEAARLSAAFEDLFRSLCGARPPFLARENDAPKLPGVYEFPREFRKLRPALVQFLVDLCRPSQLTVGPFLRGFYFSGVRPVVVSEVAPSQVIQAPAKQDRDAAFGATSIFRADAMAQAAVQAAAPRVVGSRKVPQWVFLSKLFHDLLLADGVAMGVSGSSAKTSLLRRILFASAAFLCLIYSIFLIVSYSKNHALETRALDAARNIQTVESGGVKLASLDALRRLDALRQSLATLAGYSREGAPMSYHWGLYVGDDLYPDVSRVYFESFRRVLLGQTQASLVGALSNPPPTAGSGCSPTYESLKAYLITTSNHEESTREFLPPVLIDRWSQNQNVDPERMQLARKQFDFYSDELKIKNPLSSVNDADAIAKARRYLYQCGGSERVYAAMRADAAKINSAINFNNRFPGSVDTVLETHEVPAEFTKGGWEFMRNAFKNPSTYFKKEQWVLPDQGAPGASQANLVKELTDRYNLDFTKQWRAYLKGASVQRYKNIQDAAKKLDVLQGAGSPLLELFSLASANTNVDEPSVKSVFQPVQTVVTPGSERLVGPSNQPYMGALLSLQLTVDAAAKVQPLNDAVTGPVFKSASDARTATKQAAQTFVVDPEGHVEQTVQRLMEDPITDVERLFKNAGPEELNAKGKEFCRPYGQLLAKYPFTSNPSAQQATVTDVNAIFAKPEGALWKFYEDSLKKLLTKNGAKYEAASGPFPLTGRFVNFFNQAAAFSDTIYAGGSPDDPHVTFTLKPIPLGTIQGVAMLDGQSTADAKPITWRASATHSAKGTLKFGTEDLGWANKDGVWAIWKFFADAETWEPAGSATNLDWIVRAGKDPMMLSNGKPMTVRFQLDMLGAPPVFQKGYLSKMVCVPDLAK